jgi:hypothetical protein
MRMEGDFYCESPLVCEGFQEVLIIRVGEVNKVSPTCAFRNCKSLRMSKCLYALDRSKATNPAKWNRRKVIHRG